MVGPIRSMVWSTKSWSPHVQTQQRSKMPNKMVNDCINDPYNHHFCLLLLSGNCSRAGWLYQIFQHHQCLKSQLTILGAPIVHLRCDSTANVTKFAYIDVMSVLVVLKKWRSKQTTYKFMSWIEAWIHKQDEKGKKGRCNEKCKWPVEEIPLTKVPNDERYLHLLKFK